MESRAHETIKAISLFLSQSPKLSSVSKRTGLDAIRYPLIGGFAGCVKPTRQAAGSSFKTCPILTCRE